MDDMYKVDLEDSSDPKSNSDSFEKDFDDIKSDSDCNLYNVSKLQVNPPVYTNGEYIVSVNTYFRPKDDSPEYIRKVNRKYSEFEWLDKQLKKSFPGGLIPNLPSVYDISKANMGPSEIDQDAEQTSKELSYNPNNYVTISNYLRWVLESDRFKNFIKLKEFMTNPEQIKNIHNMDHDDPIYYNKVMKFLRSTGKTALSFTTPKESKNKPFIEMKGGEYDPSTTDERTASQIEELLRSVKDVIDLQVSNLNELCTSLEVFIKHIASDKKCYRGLNQSFEDIAEIETKKDLKHAYTAVSTTSEGLQQFQNELAAYVKNDILICSRKLLARYISVQNAVNRLIDLSTDVEDLKAIAQKHKNDHEKYETYKAEYEHYLCVLRGNYDGLREDASKMQKKHDKHYKDIINAFLKSQQMYFQGINKHWETAKIE